MLKLNETLKSYRILASNFTSLTLLQISNYLFPLILLPYLVRVLGIEKYGLINFAFAFNAYFITLTDYGFNLSGTKYISIYRKDSSKLSSAFSSIIFIKFLLFIVSIIVLLTVVFTFERFSNEWEVFIAGSGFVLGNILFPLWFYQGTEKMKYILFIQISFKLCFLVSVFILITTKNDYILYVILLSSTQILIGFVGLLVAYIKFKVKFLLPNTESIKYHFKEGWNLFLSTVSINVYTASNTFILGLFASDSVVGHFAAADKIRLAAQGVIATVSQTVYPYLNNLLKKSFEAFSAFVKKVLVLQAVLGLLISLFLFLFSESIVEIVLGSNFTDSVLILQLLSPLLLLISLSNEFGIQIMLPMGVDKPFVKILLSAALVHIIVLFLLIPNFLAVGTSVSMLVTETFVTVMMFIFVYRKSQVLSYRNV